LSGLARSIYNYYLKQQGTDKYCVVKQKIEKIFTENKQRYGYRRILLVLRRQGIKLNHKTVHKLMRSMGLHGKRRKSKYKSYKGEVGKVAANILSRDFAADKPFEKLATDVTEFAVCDDKVYLSPIIDLHNKEVISYSSFGLYYVLSVAFETLSFGIASLDRNARSVLRLAVTCRTILAAFLASAQSWDLLKSNN